MFNIGFFVGHENYLPHAALLCRSLSDHFPKEKGFRVHAMIPWHLDIEIGAVDVKQVGFEVPPALRHIPFADKMYAAAAFEAHCGGRYLWLDVDSFFFKPAGFPETGGILVNPVDMKNIGDVFGEARSEFWRILLDYFCLAPADDSVAACASQERIYPYFNAGMVVVNSKRNLFGMTRNALACLLAREDIRSILQKSAPHAVFFHQAVLTCAVLKLYEYQDIQRLPDGVNYPMHLHANHKAPVPLNDLVGIRYDTYFKNNEVPAQWEHIFSDVKNKLTTKWYYQA